MFSGGVSPATKPARGVSQVTAIDSVYTDGGCLDGYPRLFVLYGRAARLVGLCGQRGFDQEAGSKQSQHTDNGGDAD